MAQAILAQAQACPLLPPPIASPLISAICGLPRGLALRSHFANLPQLFENQGGRVASSRNLELI
jgi:hypothetical protein